jgi:hypothetical protein
LSSFVHLTTPFDQGKDLRSEEERKSLHQPNKSLSSAKDMKGVENMLQMQEIVFYWVGKRIYGPDLRSVDQPEAF